MCSAWWCRSTVGVLVFCSMQCCMARCHSMVKTSELFVIKLPMELYISRPFSPVCSRLSDFIKLVCTLRLAFRVSNEEKLCPHRRRVWLAARDRKAMWCQCVDCFQPACAACSGSDNASYMQQQHVDCIAAVLWLYFEGLYFVNLGSDYREK